MLNDPCDSRALLPDRIFWLVTAIQNTFRYYAKDPHPQAKEHFYRLKNANSGEPNECLCLHYQWSEILFIRDGAIQFPSPHVRIDPEIVLGFCPRLEICLILATTDSIIDESTGPTSGWVN
jgi:hypothetical protein